MLKLYIVIIFFCLFDNQEDTCKYKAELAAAFVKNVVNITEVRNHDSVSPGSMFLSNTYV